MNTLEAMIAVMMLLGIVGIAMQVHVRSAKVLGDSALYKRVVEKTAYSLRSSGISSGNVGGNYETYRRWYFCKGGRAGC